MCAGLIGSVLGLGGGIVVVPFLTLVLHVDIRFAVAASLVSVVATSSAAAASFLRDRLTNVRLAVFLELGTVSGALTGFFIAQRIESDSLFTLFGCLLLVSSGMMLRSRSHQMGRANHPWVEKLKLDGTIVDAAGHAYPYFVERAPFGLCAMYLAGVLSALFGIGSGILKVPVMDGVMRLPIKVSSATSNFMIGVTASAGAVGYFVRGDIRPQIAGPVALGIIVGAWMGARLMPLLPVAWIRRVFVVVLCLTGLQMIARGLGWR